jgi:acyl carrier protein
MSITAETDITTRLFEVFEQITGLPASAFQRDRRLSEDLQVDSLTMIELAVAIQDELDVAVADESIKSLVTVGDVIDLVVQAQHS